MKLHEMGLLDEVFTHIGEDDAKTQTSYNVTALTRYIEAHPDEVRKVSVPVDAEHAQYCLAQRGVEQDRIKVLIEHPEYLKKPIMFIRFEDDSHLLVDGTHRYVVYWWAKGQNIPAYIVPWAVAAPFVIENAPQTTEDELMAWSGISLLRKVLE